MSGTCRHLIYYVVHSSLMMSRDNCIKLRHAYFAKDMHCKVLLLCDDTIKREWVNSENILVPESKNCCFLGTTACHYCSITTQCPNVSIDTPYN